MRLVVLFLALTATPLVAAAQIVRPPELRLQYHRAERAFRSGSSLQEARARLDAVIEALPEDADAIMLRAQVLLALGKATEAVQDAQAAVELQPENGEAFLLLCETTRAAGEALQARAALERAGALITDGAELHVRLSHNAQMLGDLDQAEAFGRLAVALDESLAATYQQLARVFVAKSRPDAAAMTLAGGLENGFLSQADVTRDAQLRSLSSRPELARWFQD